MYLTFGIKSKFEELDRDIRGLERRMEKEELRTKQILVMFKMILEKVHNSRRGPKTVKIATIVDYMDRLIHENFEPSEVRESDDLISELIKKGLK